MGGFPLLLMGRKKWVVIFNGTTTSVVVSDGANIQDLADSEFTAEIWARVDGWGQNNAGRFFDKTGSGAAGWAYGVSSTWGIDAIVNLDGTHAKSRSGTSCIDVDGGWYHVVMHWNDALVGAARVISLAVNGVWVTSYANQSAGVGTIVTDVGDDLYMGDRSDGIVNFDGAFGWGRISNNNRYNAGTDFVPVRIPPPVDANTVVQWNFDEGQGTTLDNEEGTAAYDGTISNGVWRKAFRQ